MGPLSPFRTLPKSLRPRLLTLLPSRLLRLLLLTGRGVMPMTRLLLVLLPPSLLLPLLLPPLSLLPLSLPPPSLLPLLLLLLWLMPVLLPVRPLSPPSSSTPATPPSTESTKVPLPSPYCFTNLTTRHHYKLTKALSRNPVLSFL